MMKDALFGGVNAAVLTPMNADLSVDLDRMAAHCRWLLANGCNGLGVLGTTGEANSLGISERIDVLEGLVARGIPAAKMMPGTGTTATDRYGAADQAGADARLPRRAAAAAVLLQKPLRGRAVGLFQRGDPARRRRHQVLPVQFPAAIGGAVQRRLIGRLLKAYPGKVKGIKDSSGNYENGLRLCREFRQATASRSMPATTRCCSRCWKMGSAGCITAAANVNCADRRAGLCQLEQRVGAQAHEMLTATRKAVISAPAADPRAEGAGGAQYRRRALAQHPSAAPEIDRRTAGETVRGVRRERRATGEGGIAGSPTG